jgi:monoamine oxidase
LANVGGSSLCTIDVAGKFGRGLAAQGEPAMQAFALDWLAGLFGSEVKRGVKRTHVTQWGKDPWILGAFSAAAPGAQPMRRVLAEPVRDRVWFAGEAAHEMFPGSVEGAWESGEQAADAALKLFGRR